MSELPSWLNGRYDQLLDRYRANALPHALLVVGTTGQGSQIFCETLVRTMMCSKQERYPCGSCHSCHMTHQSTHPDLYLITPDGKSETIKVDTIRRSLDKVTETSQQGGNKIVWLTDAERMNVNAANAMLKLLEEPPADTFFVLQVSSFSSTLPTIRSRCERVLLPLASSQQSLDYLNKHGPNSDHRLALFLSDQEPLAAAEFSEQQLASNNRVEAELLSDKPMLDVVSALNSETPDRLLCHLQRLVEWNIRSFIGVQYDNPEISGSLQAMLNTGSVEAWFEFRDYLLSKRRLIEKQVTFNNQLFLEDLVSRWQTVRGIA